MSDRAFVATRKGLFTLARSGGKWKIAQASFLGDNCSMCLADPRSGKLYAGLNHGHFGCKLHRSADGGKTWTEIAAPAYPEQPAGWEEPPNPMSGKRTPWRLELIWALETGSPRQDGRLWCGTIPGGLFRSDDHGDSWTLIRSLWERPERKYWFGGGFDYGGIHSVCVDPRDAKKVTVGVSCGGAWRTTDEGETWNPCSKGMRAEYMPPEQAYEENAQDPHRLVQCPAAPDNYWVQHHNGVFRTTNDCGQWSELRDVPPAVFGFAVVVHPQKPDTAWTVPAIKDEKRIPVGGQVVVTRTRDGGRTFDVLRSGLPQEHAYDLVFRHALDVDASGERLMFGSTTGSLWVSENGGDHWETISTHLPPVHAVRFG